MMIFHDPPLLLWQKGFASAQSTAGRVGTVVGVEGGQQ